MINNTYARKETVIGRLTPDIGLVRLQAKEFSTVQEVFVRQGDIVEAGTALFKITKDTTLDTGGQATDQLLAHLGIEEKEVTQRLILMDERLQTQQDEISAQHKVLKKEISGIYTQLALQKNRIEISHNQYELYEELFIEDSASRIEVDAAKERWLSQQQEQNRLHQQISDRQSQQHLLEIRLASLPNAQNISKSELRERLASIAQRRTSLQQQGGYVVTTPVAGRIATVQVKQGKALAPNDFEIAIFLKMES